MKADKTISKLKSHYPIAKDYILTLSKSWFLRIALIGDVIGVIASTFFPNLDIPRPYFLTIAVFAFGYSGYIIYFKTVNAIPEKYKPGIPKLDISLIEGSSYSYFLQMKNSSNQPRKSSKKSISNLALIEVIDGELPSAVIIINARIHNNGDIPLNILSINSRFSSDVDSAYQFMNSKIFQKNSSPFQYPSLINPNETIVIKIEFPIWPSTLKTEAQIAVRFYNLLKNGKKENLKISVEVSQFNNEIAEFKNYFDISLTPLYDLILEYWKWQNNNNILNLINIKI